MGKKKQIKLTLSNGETILSNPFEIGESNTESEIKDKYNFMVDLSKDDISIWTKLLEQDTPVYVTVIVPPSYDKLDEIGGHLPLSPLFDAEAGFTLKYFRASRDFATITCVDSLGNIYMLNLDSANWLKVATVTGEVASVATSAYIPCSIDDMNLCIPADEISMYGEFKFVLIPSLWDTEEWDTLVQEFFPANYQENQSVYTLTVSNGLINWEFTDGISNWVGNNSNGIVVWHQPGAGDSTYSKLLNKDEDFDLVDTNYDDIFKHDHVIIRIPCEYTGKLNLPIPEDCDLSAHGGIWEVWIDHTSTGTYLKCSILFSVRDYWNNHWTCSWHGCTDNLPTSETSGDWEWVKIATTKDITKEAIGEVLEQRITNIEEKLDNIQIGGDNNTDSCLVKEVGINQKVQLEVSYNDSENTDELLNINVYKYKKITLLFPCGYQAEFEGLPEDYDKAHGGVLEIFISLDSENQRINSIFNFRDFFGNYWTASYHLVDEPYIENLVWTKVNTDGNGSNNGGSSATYSFAGQSMSLDQIVGWLNNALYAGTQKVGNLVVNSMKSHGMVESAQGYDIFEGDTTEWAGSADDHIDITAPNEGGGFDISQFSLSDYYTSMDRIPFKYVPISQISDEEIELPPNFTKNDIIHTFCLDMEDLTEEQLSVLDGDSENFSELFMYMELDLDYIWNRGGESTIGRINLSSDLLEPRSNILLRNKSSDMARIDTHNGDELVSGYVTYLLGAGGNDTKIYFPMFLDTSLLSSNKKGISLTSSTYSCIESGIYYKLKPQDKSIATLSLSDDEPKQLSKAERFKKVKEKIIKAFNKNKNYE